MSLKDTDVRTPGEQEIAKKFKISLAKVRQLINQGAKHEKEHNTNVEKAKEVARDHIAERPDYYKMLKKAEKTDKNHMKESSTGAVRGLGYVSGDPAGTDYVQQYINTNAMSYNNQNGNAVKWMKKHTKGHNKVGFDEYDPRKLKEGLSTEPEREIPVVGDLTGAPRTIAKGSTKIDEIKMPKVPAKVKKVARGAMVAANLATLGQVAGDAAEGRKGADPKRGLVAATSTLPGAVGWGATGLNYTIKGFDKAREHIRARQVSKMKEQKNVVPAETTARGIYEATFQGKKVSLNKPMKGDVKKSKVFVDPDGDGKAQKVNFGDPNMTIKKSNPARRKSFRARHNCDNPGPKTKARYWSCRAWEETQIGEDWQSVNRKDKTDGLSQAAVNAYRRENPGSKLKTAVTEKNPTGKRASRRKSFCSRMGGMKKRLTSAKTARDPDSRINKALRRWNCEESLINELRAETLGSYIKKSAASRKKSLEGPKPDVTTWAKREHGIRTAIKKLTKEETKMDTKNIINEAIDNILDNNLVDMKENLLAAIQEKAIERLEEKKKDIAANYFAQ